MMADDDADASPEPAADIDGGKPESREDAKPENKEDSKQDGKPESKEDGKSERKRGGRTAHNADEDQERRDRFAEAAGDPLADALGGSSAQAWEGQARRSWMRTVHASGAAAFVGGGSIGVLNITTSSYPYARVGQAPGPLSHEVITELVNRYVPVPGYAGLVKQLSSNRLLVLRGAPGTGRATTGLRLLAKLAANVARFSPDTDFRALTDADLEPDSGYLLELSRGSGFLPPTPADVDRVRQRLAERRCYLVLIASHDIRYRDGFDGSVADCPLPDPREVYDQAVDYEIRHRPGEEEALRKIAALAQPRISAGPQTPAEVRWLVAHLMSSPATNYSEADLDLLNGDLAARYVSAWFEPLAALPVTPEGDEPVRLAAFRIALAVLNGGPLDLVAEAAEDLARRILKARARRRKISLPVFAHHREDYVANSRASVAPGTVRFIEATAPAQLVCYDDDRLPLAVLRHVWAVHNLRGQLLAWLESLSNDRRPLVYWSAALTIGLLTSWDFSYTFHQWIEPWAGSDRDRRRWTAAVALDEASRNPDVRPVVREMLGEWRKKGTFEERWTCAIALGFDLGLRDPAKALTELRKLACWEDGRLTGPASWAVARIFVLSGVKPVIKTLTDWLDDDRRNVRLLGLFVVQRIADNKVSELEDNLELTTMNAVSYWTRLPSRRRWPLLVALADEDPALLNPFVDLVWQLTRSARAEKASADILKRWIRAGEKDPTCIGPVGRFMALLGDDHADRARLLHILRSLRRDPDEPLPAAIADRLERAIEFNVHTTDESR
jgi:hypothetical protein